MGELRATTTVTYNEPKPIGEVCDAFQKHPAVRSASVYSIYARVIEQHGWATNAISDYRTEWQYDVELILREAADV